MRDHAKALGAINNKDQNAIDQWKEQAIQLMYYGEANDCAGIEDQAFDAIESILKFAKLERRVGTVIMMQKVMIEYNLAHPRLIEIIER